MIFNNSSRVLITGINGFTGYYIEEALASEGYSVFGFGRLDSCKNELLNVNLLDMHVLNNAIKQVNPNMVIHLAGVSYVNHSNDNAFYNVNIIGTRNLLRALHISANQVDAILLSSSASVYGGNIGGRLAETTPTNPLNDYAVSKLAMEHMAMLWSDKLPIFITRPFNYTGVGQSSHFIIPKIVKHFKRREAIIELGNIDIWRDFNDIRVLSKAYIALLKKKPLGEIINICSGKAYSLREVIGFCEKITGHSLEVKVNPALIRSQEAKILCGDASKLMTILGERYVLPIQETLRWMLES